MKIEGGIKNLNSACRRCLSSKIANVPSENGSKTELESVNLDCSLTIVGNKHKAKIIGFRIDRVAEPPTDIPVESLKSKKLKSKVIISKTAPPYCFQLKTPK